MRKCNSFFVFSMLFRARARERARERERVRETERQSDRETERQRDDRETETEGGWGGTRTPTPTRAWTETDTHLQLHSLAQGDLSVAVVRVVGVISVVANYRKTPTPDYAVPKSVLGTSTRPF